MPFKYKHKEENFLNKKHKSHNKLRSFIKPENKTIWNQKVCKKLNFSKETL